LEAKASLVVWRAQQHTRWLVSGSLREPRSGAARHGGDAADAQPIVFSFATFSPLDFSNARVVGNATEVRGDREREGSPAQQQQRAAAAVFSGQRAARLHQPWQCTRARERERETVCALVGGGSSCR